jgi:hypothetical protein
MQKKPYQKPRLRVITTPTDAMRKLFAEAKEIREIKVGLPSTPRPKLISPGVKHAHHHHA